MSRILNKLLDTLFPPRDSQLLLRSYADTHIPIETGCHQGIFYCAHYTKPVIHAAINENKFHNSLHAQRILSHLITTWIDQKDFADVCFIPIPLGKERQHNRGHNQVLSVLHQTHYLVQPVLQRVRETPPQVSLDRQHRLHNIKNVFAVDERLLATLTGKTLIILDDVVTTGATLNEARASLAPHLPAHTQCICLALAH